MAKTNKRSSAKVAAMKEKEINTNETKEVELDSISESANNAHIEASIVEDKKKDKPIKSSKRQGVIVEARLASIVVQDENGFRFRLVGVKGNLGDIIEF